MWLFIIYKKFPLNRGWKVYEHDCSGRLDGTFPRAT